MNECYSFPSLHVYDGPIAVPRPQEFRCPGCVCVRVCDGKYMCLKPAEVKSWVLPASSLPSCACGHVCTHVHSHTCAATCVQPHVCSHACSHMCAVTCMPSCAQSHTCSHMCAVTCVQSHVCSHVHIIFEQVPTFWHNKMKLVILSFPSCSPEVSHFPRNHDSY